MKMSKMEYLEFEKLNYDYMDAESIYLNRINWNVSILDLQDFYTNVDYLNHRVILTKNNKYIKVFEPKNKEEKTNKVTINSRKKTQNKESVLIEQKTKATSNFTMEKVKENAKLFDYIYTQEENVYVRFRNKKTNEYYSYSTKDLSDPNTLYNILNSDKFSTNEDMMYSLNIYNNMKNATDKDLLLLNLIAIDVDFGEIKRFLGENPIHLINVLEKNEFDKTIPKPQIIEYGRHLRLIYALEKVPATQGSKTLAKRLSTVIGERLADYGGSAQPLTTYGRIIGSVNSKGGQTIKVMYLNEDKYTLKDLQSKWLEPLPQWYPEWKAKSNRKVINLSRDFNKQSSFYKYNELRINDIYRIQRFYEYDCDGFKRFLCFQLRNHLILNGVSHEDAKNQMLEFNQNFKKPLNWRVIESDTRNVERKQYQYRSETILNFIGITKEEEILLNLEGILSKDEYKRRQQISNKICQKKRYRNENNLTKTEEKRLEEFTKIAELELQGLSLRQIAKEFGDKDHKRISQKMNKQYDKINYKEIKEKIIEQGEIINY